MWVELRERVVSHTLAVCRRSRREERGEDVVEAKRLETASAMRVRNLGENMVADRMVLRYNGDLKRTRSRDRDRIAAALDIGQSI